MYKMIEKHGYDNFAKACIAMSDNGSLNEAIQEFAARNPELLNTIKKVRAMVQPTPKVSYMNPNFFGESVNKPDEQTI
jgi:hypothetical protein